MEINAAEFKAKCLKLLDEVAASGRPLVITKRGRPVAQLVPVPTRSPAPLFGFLKGAVSFHHDVLAPGGETWSAETGDEDDLYAAPEGARR